MELEERKEAEKEKARLKEKLLQTQKMEALGTLTGGTAHDFNNLLQIMFGHAQMLLMNKDKIIPLPQPVIKADMYMAFSEKTKYTHLLPEINRLIIKFK
ncbi:MAG: hypothetical protein GY797_26250, partial [Deltaproteobacteria bacterium]|nr:hypothetical protein [Deltaproteobacteria bacterium]